MNQFPKWPTIPTMLGQPPMGYGPQPPDQQPRMRRPNDQRRRRPMPGGPPPMRPPDDQRMGTFDVNSIVERALQNILMQE